MTATSKGARVTLAALALLTASGCGVAAVHRSGTVAASAVDPFRWLRAGPPPAGWRVARTPAGATLAYPPGWTAIAGDRGSISAALRDGGGAFLGYLNLTPRQGGERLSNWASFRVRHNRAEGDGDVRLMALAPTVRFPAGRGACVQDSYTTSTGARYVEIACLVQGPRPSVVVGAAPPEEWATRATTIERAMSSVDV